MKKIYLILIIFSLCIPSQLFAEKIDDIGSLNFTKLEKGQSPVFLGFSRATENSPKLSEDVINSETGVTMVYKNEGGSSRFTTGRFYAFAQVFTSKPYRIYLFASSLKGEEGTSLNWEQPDDSKLVLYDGSGKPETPVVTEAPDDPILNYPRYYNFPIEMYVLESSLESYETLTSALTLVVEGIV